jgi:hypothetical protein
VRGQHVAVPSSRALSVDLPGATDYGMAMLPARDGSRSTFSAPS